MRFHWLTVVLSISLVTSITSCSSGGGSAPVPGPGGLLDGAGLLEKDIYERALSALDAKQAGRAIEFLNLLEAQFPFGAYAEQGQLELIYAHYLATNYESAAATADRFIRLHPDHPNIDYAYYMRGLISYSSDSSFFGQILPVDITKRDLGSAREAYTHFSELLIRYPDSPYGQDARKRIIYIRNLLARHEINVANYYFKRGAYLSATNRGRYVVENFQGSPAVADGLAVMAQGYTLLGYDQLAENSVAVLRDNFPNHPILDADGNFERKQLLAGQERSLLNRLSLGLLGRPEPLGFDTRELYNPEYGAEQPKSEVARAEDNVQDESEVATASNSLEDGSDG